MKGKFYRSFVLVIVTVSVTVGLAAAAKPYKSALDNVPRFLDAIKNPDSLCRRVNSITST